MLSCHTLKDYEEKVVCLKMALIIPFSLEGKNLGERHRYLNSLVNDTYKKQVPFLSIQNLPELSPIDRLFKIDLASKCKNVDYIIQTLKDEDMLYVSRALKSFWLLDVQYANIINPTYLENELFPEMLITAVNKFMHVIQYNLKDTERCQEFYEYYRKKGKCNTAYKFLLHCSENYLSKLITTPEILFDLKPKYLKILCEKCPKLVKCFFENIDKCDKFTSTYILTDNIYYKNMKNILKLDCDVLLDVLENYFNNDSFSPLRPKATKYILKHHKSRFNNKPELYAAWLLDLKTVAKYLDENEIKDLIVKLAKAEYLSSWFTYKSVEPLFKGLSSENRNALKNMVFVEKNIGDKIKDWPYTPPAPPQTKFEDQHIFLDKEYYDSYSEDFADVLECCGYAMRSDCLKSYRRCPKNQTVLDELFDRYRFKNFELTFYELRKMIKAESLSQIRQYMMLVLVSKSGGREDHLGKLLQWLIERHLNEPVTVRATVVRSLVNRACVWRLSCENWDMLLKFSQDLGLDGNPPAAACDEGLHAVILRDMLRGSDTISTVCDAFYNNFSTLQKYCLNVEEKNCVIKRLPAMLLKAAEMNKDLRNERLSQLLDVLKDYNLPVTGCQGAVPAIISTAQYDPEAARPLLQSLYTTGAARRELFKENFAFLQTNESYLNALRHDPSILMAGDKFKTLIEKHNLRQNSHEGFLRKLAIYFSEDEGLRNTYLAILLHHCKLESDSTLARPVALLSDVIIMQSLLNTVDSETAIDNKKKRLGSVLRANLHVSRPSFDITEFGWRAAGAKAVANKVLICSVASSKRYMPDLIGWKNTARLALILAQRVGEEAETFKAVALLRPTVAIKEGLRYFRQRGELIDKRVWISIKPLIEQLELASDSHKRLLRSLSDIDSMPACIKIEYCSTIYTPLKKISKEVLVTSKLDKLLTEIEDNFIINIVKDVMNKSIPQKQSEDTYDRETDKYKRETIAMIRIFGKFMFLSKSEQNQQYKLLFVVNVFKWFQNLWKVNPEMTLEILDEFISSLCYQTVFFDGSYVSALPVFEKVVTEFHKFLPVEIHFQIYVNLHLTMLYYKSIQQSVKQNPTIFANKSKKEVEGVEIVGKIFGKYIAHETEVLISNYFLSIRDIYQNDLLEYINNNFNNGESRNKFLCAIISGILDNISSTMDPKLLGEYLFQHVKHYDVKSESSSAILDVFKKINNQEIQFFMNADIYSYI